MVRLFRLADGKEVASHQADPGLLGLTPAWEPRGQFIAFATGNSYKVHLWNPSSINGQDAIINLRGFTGELTVSPDGSHLVVGNSGSNCDNLSVFRLGE